MAEHYSNLKNLDSRNKINSSLLISVKNQQILETFLFGNVMTEGFSKQDSKENPYVMQQFVHHFKLELFWAIFPTIKCLIILIPSLILLYSSASLKFYDNVVQVTANQWYWNFSSTVLVETKFLSTSFFFTRSQAFDYFFDFKLNMDTPTLFEFKTTANVSQELYFYALISSISEDFFITFIKFFDKSEVLDLSEVSRYTDIINIYDFNQDYPLSIFTLNRYVEFVTSINNDSFMIADNDLKIGQQRVLDTDSHLIVSSLRSTKFLVNALDVLHSFVILSTGIKVDAIVGRINEMSVFFLREGLFFGQCSELCGSGHFGMPIVVESLEPFDFFGYFEDKKWTIQSSKTIVPYLFDSDFFDPIAEAEFNKFLSLH